jgi:hypothetical protein
MTDYNFVLQIINRLRQNKILNVVLVFLYSMIILFLHEPMVNVTLKIISHLSLKVFNQVVAGICIIFLIAFLATLVNRLLKYKKNIITKLFFLFTSAGFMIIHSQIMFEMNIEIIHSFEYSLLAFLLFPLFNRFGAAIIFSLPVMLIDEWMQYQVMYIGYVQFLELNDILMDTLGCGFMMVTIWIFGVEPERKKMSFKNSAEFIFLFLLITVIISLLFSCKVSFYETTKCSNTWLVLNQLENPFTFWQIHPYHGSKYHVMKPAEGFFAILSFCLFYSSIDFLKKK